MQELTWGKSSDRTSETSSEARVGVKGYSSMCSSSLLASFTRCRLLCTSRAAVCTKGELSLPHAHPLFQPWTNAIKDYSHLRSVNILFTGLMSKVGVVVNCTCFSDETNFQGVENLQSEVLCWMAGASSV